MNKIYLQEWLLQAEVYIFVRVGYEKMEEARTANEKFALMKAVGGFVTSLQEKKRAGQWREEFVSTHGVGDEPIFQRRAYGVITCLKRNFLAVADIEGEIEVDAGSNCAGLVVERC